MSSWQDTSVEAEWPVGLHDELASLEGVVSDARCASLSHVLENLEGPDHPINCDGGKASDAELTCLGIEHVGVTAPGVHLDEVTGHNHG